MTLPFERAQTRRPVSWLTLLGVLLLPAVIGGILVAALYNPTERLDAMNTAIVNNDEPVEVNGQTTPLGRLLTAGLVEGSDDLDSNLPDEGSFRVVSTPVQPPVADPVPSTPSRREPVVDNQQPATTSNPAVTAVPHPFVATPRTVEAPVVAAAPVDHAPKRFQAASLVKVNESSVPVARLLGSPQHRASHLNRA